MQTKQLCAEIEASTDQRSFTATITTSAVDREGEVLLPEGMQASEFERNPVVFWNHDYAQPIGRAISLERHRGHWRATAVFADRPDEHEGEWLPDTVHALMRQGVIRGVSVGFTPIETRRPTPRDRELFGDTVRRVVSKWKLLEFSVTPLPANQDALVTAVSKGLISPTRCEDLFGSVPDPPATRRVIMLSARPSIPETTHRVLMKARGAIYSSC